MISKKIVPINEEGFGAMPQELLERIFSYVTDFKDIVRLPRVCKRWSEGCTFTPFHFPKLPALYNMTLTDNALSTLTTRYPRIRGIDLSECHNLTDAALMSLEKCTGLTYVNFYGCYKLTDDTVRAFATNCPGLTYVNFGKCYNLTTASVKSLAEKCKKLTSVYLRECPKLTDTNKTQLKRLFPTNCNLV